MMVADRLRGEEHHHDDDSDVRVIGGGEGRVRNTSEWNPNGLGELGGGGCERGDFAAFGRFC